MDNNDKDVKSVLDKTLGELLDLVPNGCLNTDCESCPLYLPEKALIRRRAKDNKYITVMYECLISGISYLKELL